MPNGTTGPGATATATVNQVKPTATIDETGTTCTQIANGTAIPLPGVKYALKGTKINQTNPGVFFYDSKITAPSASFTINILQSNTNNWPVLTINQNQFILWDANCTKVQSVTLSADGTLTVNGATAGATYYVQVKYETSKLLGISGVGKPTVTYLFQTSLNGGAAIPSSGATVTVSPK